MMVVFLHPARAQDVCADVAGKSVAFARASPLLLYGEDSLQRAERVSLRFGVAYPVIDRTSAALRICTNIGARWVKRAHMVASADPRWVTLPETVRAAEERPVVSFWRSRERLSSFYSGAGVGKAPPDYDEVIGPDIDDLPGFPVTFSDFVEMNVGSRQLEVASILVPFPREAAIRYAGERAKAAEAGDFGAVERSFAGTLSAMAEARYLPLLPKDIGNEETLATPSSFATRSDWFTATLWATVNGTILTFEEEGGDPARPAALDLTPEELPLADAIETERRKVAEVASAKVDPPAPDPAMDKPEEPDREDDPAPEPEKTTPGYISLAGTPREGAGNDAACATGPDRRPLRREDIGSLERRALSLPGATIHATPGGEVVDAEPPTLSIYYVYCDRSEEGWIEIGSNAFGKTVGWVEADRLEDWRSMVVMQFTQRGSARQRVLFFREEADLVDVVIDAYADEVALETYDAIAANEHDADIFVAIEPATPTAFTDRPFMMPVLDWQFEMFDNGQESTLIRIAGVNTDAEATVSDSIGKADARDVGRLQRELKEFRFGVKFVIDTTASMGPYIDLTQRAVEHFYDAFESGGALDKVSFGLLAYRDSKAHDNRIEYVTREFQKLTTDTRVEDVLSNINMAEASEVSTRGWDEDAFAGLYQAITARDWEDFDFRFIVLITDAGARSAGDPLLQNPDIDEFNIRTFARNRDIAILPLHLVTPEAVKEGNIARAAEQYRVLGKTGDQNVSKYTPIETGDERSFDRKVRALADDLVESLTRAGRGRLVDAGKALEASRMATGREESSDAAFRYAVVNEIFRAQMEFLGKRKGETPPRFYRAWASDRDLVDPALVSMRASVFLTRNQLSELAQSVSDIVDVSRREGDSSKFFEELQRLAARTAVEGGRTGRKASTVETLMPDFIAALPYRSKILRMTERRWLAQGNTGRDQFVGELKRKLRAYRELEGDAGIWLDIDAGDTGLDVTPVDLDLLP